MKKILLVLAFVISGVSLFAQPAGHPKDGVPPLPPPPPPAFCGKPALPPIEGLTKEQSDKIHSFEMNMEKKNQPVLNQVKELEAKLHTLATSENPSADALNKLIDEISTQIVKVKKEEMSFVQSVRKLLTEEQRLMFDRLPPPPPPAN